MFLLFRGFSFVFHAAFQVGVLALEEFRWKTFLGEDLEPLVALVVSFAWEIVSDSPMINFVSQTMNKSMLPGNAKCSMASLADISFGRLCSKKSILCF